MSVETKDNGTVEAVKVAQDAARRYMDESASIGRAYFNAWAATVQASMRTAFDLQSTMMQASRSVADAAAKANRDWMDQASDSMKKSQEATARLVCAGVDVVETAMPKARP
jgi:hypothetical protein